MTDTEQQRREFTAKIAAEDQKPSDPPPKPVNHWENREVQGAALACKRVHDREQEKIKELRERQQAYEASLPKDPLEALKAIAAEQIEIRDPYLDDSAAFHALSIIYELTVDRDECAHMDESIKWLALLGRDALQRIEKRAERIHDIASQFHPWREPFEA